MNKKRQDNPERQKLLIVANTSWFLLNFLLRFMKEVQSQGIDVVAVAPDDKRSAQFKEYGIRHIIVPMNRRGLNPLADIVLFARFFRIYRRERPDYVFHNTIKPVIYGSFAARCARVKLVLNMIPGLGYVFVDDGNGQKPLRFLVKYMYRLALKCSHKVFFQNPDDQDYFVRNSLVDEKLTEVTYGLGVDLDHFRYEEHKPKLKECTFILVSRMLWDKGVGEYVDASRILKESFPAAKFQLLGRIDLHNPRHIDEQTINNWVKSGHIEYLGELSDVRTALRCADAVVLPSYYREGIPNALMEAMAMGKPIVTTDTPGCRETVVDNVNGILIPPRDVDALVEAMRFMIENPETRTMMGKKGRQLAVERFDVTRVNSMLLKAIHVSK